MCIALYCFFATMITFSQNSKSLSEAVRNGWSELFSHTKNLSIKYVYTSTSSEGEKQKYEAKFHGTGLKRLLEITKKEGFGNNNSDELFCINGNYIFRLFKSKKNNDWVIAEMLKVNDQDAKMHEFAKKIYMYARHPSHVIALTNIDEYFTKYGTINSVGLEKNNTINVEFTGNGKDLASIKFGKMTLDNSKYYPIKRIEFASNNLNKICYVVTLDYSNPVNEIMLPKLVNTKYTVEGYSLEANSEYIEYSINNGVDESVFDIEHYGFSNPFTLSVSKDSSYIYIWISIAGALVVVVAIILTLRNAKRNNIV